MKTSDFVKSLSIGAAAVTAKMIFENMAQRTVGKALSKITVPVFIISYLTIGGYLVSEQIDPKKGADRFTYAIMNPVEASQMTAFNLLTVAAANEVEVDISSKPLGHPGGIHQQVANSDYYKFGTEVFGEMLRQPWMF